LAGGDGQGAAMTAALPDGKTKVSGIVEAAALADAPEGLVDEEPVAMEDPRGDGLKAGKTDGEAELLGGRC